MAVSGVRHETTQSKVAVPRNGEVGDGNLVQKVDSVSLGFVGNLGQTEVDVEGQVEEDTVSGALDVVVSEHDVGLEEVNGLVNDIGSIFCKRGLMRENEKRG